MRTIIGHEGISRYLLRTVQQGTILPTYLFVGPEHIGKKTVARQFLQSLFCGAREEERPCLLCVPCTSIERRTHPDVWIEEEGEEGEIGIDAVRPFIARLSSTALGETRKAAILDHTERLTLEAANALLKTIEEPREKTLTIFLATNESALPKTLRSRLTILRFRRVPMRTIEAMLIERGATRDEAHTYAQLADGRPGQAIRSFSEDGVYETYTEDVESFLLLFSQNLFERFRDTNDEAMKQCRRRFPIWLSLLRDLLLLKVTDSWPPTHEAWRERLHVLARTYSLETFLNLSKHLLFLQSKRAANLNERFALESFFLNI